MLIWSPLICEVESKSNEGDRVIACISAYCTIEGIKRLLQSCNLESLYVISRWRTSDLALGSSDLNVYPLLKENGVPLYINYKLHSKIYLFSSGSLLCGSGNATASGLGLIDNCNIETGVVRQSLSITDEIQLKKLRDNCILVTDEVYDEFQRQVSEYKISDVRSKDDLKIYDHYMSLTGFVLSDLPVTKNPRVVIDTIKNETQSSLKKVEKQAFINDCCNYGLTPDMTGESIESTMKNSFRESPFVMAIVEEIRRCGSMRFGAVTNFVHSNCRDVPMPFRRDVKERVNTLYNWLEFCFDDLAWNVPGNKSQVIRDIS